MNILFINQFFWPDSSATSQLLTDLTRELADRGHLITVICAEGSYASSGSENPPDVKVIRLKALPFVRGKVGRLLSYLSFYSAACARAVTLRRFDIVVTLTTPPLISLVGSAVKLVHGSVHFIWEMDVYPDVAIDLAYFKRDGLMDRITGYLADRSRHYADAILALGTCMKERLEQRGIPTSKITVAENWADGAAIIPQPRMSGAGELVLLYSGNLGLAHDLDTILRAALALSGEAQYRFVFAGGGGRRHEVSSYCAEHQIDSVTMLPYASRDDLGNSLAIGDIGVVTQNEACLGSVVPSKVYGILAAGRPVLFIGPERSTPALIIDRHQCGWHLRCGDVDGLVSLLRRLRNQQAEVLDAGRRAREAHMRCYDLPIGVGRIVALLESGHRPMPLKPSLSADNSFLSSVSNDFTPPKSTSAGANAEASCLLSQF